MNEAGSTRTRGSLVLCALSLVVLSSFLPACGGCVDIERSSLPATTGLFQGLVVGATKQDGLFVVALRENAPGELDATVVSLGEEPRSCSLGPAFAYTTVGQLGVLGADDDLVDDRPGRILVLEGELGDTSGPLRVFDTSCKEVLQAPPIELSLWPILGNDGHPAAYTALTVDGSLLWIDPWTPSIRTLGEQVSRYGRLGLTTFWLVENGALVLRDVEGNTLASVGSGVTEAAPASDLTELAFVDEGGLFTMNVADQTITPIATEGTPCKLMYLPLSQLTLAYREDCAVGNLAILDRSTDEKQLFSSAVTDLRPYYTPDGWWIFFLREPPGSERELWAIPQGSEPVLVGKNPDPWAHYKLYFSEEHGFFVLLDHDGETGTLGTWTPNGGFEPLLERVGWPIPYNGLMTAVAERDGDVGTLVALDLDTLDSALHVEGVPWMRVGFSIQAPVMGYVRDWDATLGAGTFEVWVQPTGDRIVVDVGVSEFRELLWPKPGAVYAVRTPGREGLWTAYAE